MNELSKRVIRYRTINKVTQKELAEKIGISTVTLANIEAGKNVIATSRCKVELWLDENEEKGE